MRLVVPLHTAAIKNGFSNPLVIAPALPANQFYRVKDFTLEVNPGTTAFDNELGITATTDVNSVDNGQLTAGGLDSSTSVFVYGITIGNIAKTIHPGEPLYLKCGVDSTVGDGSAVAYLEVEIVDIMP